MHEHQAKVCRCVTCYTSYALRSAVGAWRLGGTHGGSSTGERMDGKGGVRTFPSTRWLGGSQFYVAGFYLRWNSHIPGYLNYCGERLGPPTGTPKSVTRAALGISLFATLTRYIQVLLYRSPIAGQRNPRPRNGTSSPGVCVCGWARYTDGVWG